MNQNILFILLVSLFFINVNSAPQKRDNYLDRHVRPFHVRRLPGRWWQNKWHARRPHVPVEPEEPEIKVGEKAERKLVCYLGSWANYRQAEGRFVMEDIDAHLCTHLVYGFAKLENNRITPFDSWLDLEDDWGLAGYRRFNDLKKKNPSLKTLIAIGGWNEGSEKYSAMASNAASRKTFVDSVVEFLTKYGFDGLDFDWEYPANRGGIPEDKANFINCLRELRTAFTPKGWLLTAAVSAGRATIDLAYDIAEINRLCDFVNLMGYDMHGAWHDYTGHNAPLFERPGEPEDERMLNINYAVNYWMSKGATASKLILGMPIYGRTFTLLNPAKHGLYDNTSGPGKAGEFTNEAGMIGYHELCKLQQTEGSLWTRYFDEYYMAPYMVKGDQWIGYDDQESVALKVRYAITKGLGGGMVWSLDTDDFKNRCGKGAFPILNHIKNTLANGSPLPIPPQPDAPTLPPHTEGPTNAPPVTSPPGGQFKCSSAGLFRHPDTCQKYYHCLPSGESYNPVEKSCAPGTFFSQKNQACDWPANVENCAADGTPKDAKHPEQKNEVDHGDKRCQGEGIFRNGNECRSFIICKENPYVGGHKYIAEEQFCPDGLVFDDKTKTCNSRQFVERCNKVVKV